MGPIRDARPSGCTNRGPDRGGSIRRRPPGDCPPTALLADWGDGRPGSVAARRPRRLPECDARDSPQPSPCSASPSPRPPRAQSPIEVRQTAAYLASFQNPDGGFGPGPGQKSTLGATSSVVRSLKNVAGSIKDLPACLAYLRSCRVEGGGFSPTPGGAPDVSTTAVGLMAVAELKIADDKTVNESVEYLAGHAKTFEEIRIAVAGLEAVKKTSPAFPEWVKKVNADRNEDGTWGQGPARAFASGSAAAALLRMRQELDHRSEVVAALRAGQGEDGAWSNGGGPSDLSSSYRIMRALFMLKEKPDLDRLRSYIARCRHADGSYSSAPGKPGDPGGTYYATTILRWVRLLDGEPVVVETAGFRPLFDGKTLNGWEGDDSLWSVRDGLLVGKTTAGLKKNEFLATENGYEDFILKFSFRLLGDDSSNTGVQFRSERVPDSREMSGYQADAGQGYWGSLYDESRRNKVLVQANEKALSAVNKGGWNQYVVRAIGRDITLTLNGVTSVSYHEDDPKIPLSGRIALQIHAGGPMEVQFKDIYIQPLPVASGEQVTTPHFLSRTVETRLGDPDLHGLPAPRLRRQEGLPGRPLPARLGRARQRRHALGEGGPRPERGAPVARLPRDRHLPPGEADLGGRVGRHQGGRLAALDDVMANFQGRPRPRRCSTGLSMGGSGSWGLAASHPDRFSCVVPICGRGKVEDVKAIQNLPAWIVVGDADRDETVLNARAMAAALREAGQAPRYTEYRAVGHNSWDRAYSDPELLRWMLEQTRKPRL